MRIAEALQVTRVTRLPRARVRANASEYGQLKEIYLESDPGDVLTKKALMGALALYLDFINLFVLLLQLTGQRRD